MIKYFKNKIKSFVVKRASANKMIDIVEVRTKEIGLTQVTTETDIRIVNSFFLPITIISLKTDLLNRDGLKIGKMNYENPQKIKRKSEEILTTTSQISIITSLFQALSTLLMQNINMRSIGIARVKILWWIFEIPINDTFEIHPSKLKIIRDLTEEEKLIRAHDKEINSVLQEQDLEKWKIEKAIKKAEKKEETLQRRHKENYVAKEVRLRQAQSDKQQAQSDKQQAQSDKQQTQSDNRQAQAENHQNEKSVSNNNIKIEDENVEIILNEKAIQKMADDITIKNELKNDALSTNKITNETEDNI